VLSVIDELYASIISKLEQPTKGILSTCKLSKSSGGPLNMQDIHSVKVPCHAFPHHPTLYYFLSSLPLNNDSCGLNSRNVSLHFHWMNDLSGLRTCQTVSQWQSAAQLDLLPSLLYISHQISLSFHCYIVNFSISVLQSTSNPSRFTSSSPSCRLKDTCLLSNECRSLSISLGGRPKLQGSWNYDMFVDMCVKQSDAIKQPLTVRHGQVCSCPFSTCGILG
jgi:hypothetical protein